MTDKYIKPVERRVVEFLNNYFKKRSKPLTEGVYNQFKEMAQKEYDKEVSKWLWFYEVKERWIEYERKNKPRNRKIPKEQ